METHNEYKVLVGSPRSDVERSRSGETQAAGLLSVRDDEGVVTARHRGGGEVVEAVLTLARPVPEAVLTVRLPGGGESVQAAAGTGAVQEGAGQQVHRGH